jgi:hypothetical protein
MNSLRALRISARVRLGKSVAISLSVVFAGGAAAAGADEAERARLGAERSAIEARFAERERECRDRFVVMSCIEDARRERRQKLDALRVRQLQLDEARRRQRTADRQAELAEKAADDARREQERAARAASAPAARGASRGLETPHEPRGEDAADRAASPRPARERPVPKAGGPKKPEPRESAAARREREERSRTDYAARQREAAEHRREVLDKAAERLKNRAPAAPLPVPEPVR